jgi:hypothetical protein
VYVVAQVVGGDGRTVSVAGGPFPLVLDAVVHPAITDETAEYDTRLGDTDTHPALADLVVTPSGLGPLTVGLRPLESPGKQMIRMDLDRCAGTRSPEPGRWVPSGYPPLGTDGEPRDAFGVTWRDDVVRWIDVFSPVPRTPEGVGIGTSLADLRSTYPTLEGPVEGRLLTVWWLSGSIGTLVFETASTDSRARAVVGMRIIPWGYDPSPVAEDPSAPSDVCAR